MVSKMESSRFELIKMTLEECNGNYNKVTKKTGATYIEIEKVDVLVNKKYNYTPEGKGPLSKQKYLVATRNAHSTEGWDNDNVKLRRAREMYDDGLVELATGRDGLNFLLYAIPRKERDNNRKPLFYPDRTGNIVNLQVRNG